MQRVIGKETEVVVYSGSEYYYRVRNESGQVLHTTALLQLDETNLTTIT